MKKVAIKTLGCKVNQYESACIVNKFEKSGFKVVAFSQNPDIFIINSCTVTSLASAKSRRILKKAIEEKRKNPSKKIVITGCYSQLEREKLSKMEEIDIVVDNTQKNSIYDILKGNEKNLHSTEFAEFKTDNFYGKKRAFIKIQDGCNQFCSYCIIPFVRNKVSSRAPMEIIKQIKILCKKGFSEFVIGGINLALYEFCENDKKYTLSDVLRGIEKIKSVKAIRLSSLNVEVFNAQFFAYLSQSKKIVPHFHLSIQSGCEKVLKKMKRRYNPKDIHKVMERIKQIFPNSAIGGDIICGFPVESENDFQKSLDFLTNQKFTYFHVFPYSQREKTVASKLPDQIPKIVKKIRCSQIRALSEEKSKDFILQLIKNRVVCSGIVEGEKNGYFYGISNRYIKFYFKKDNIKEKENITFFPREIFKDGMLVKPI